MKNKKNQNLAAAILAGGSAKRLAGLAKGNIEIVPGFTIINSLLRELSLANIADVVIVSNQQSAYQQYQVPIISDLRRDYGPLAGIESALTFFKEAQRVLFLPCDLPNINVAVILRLKKKLENLVRSPRRDNSRVVHPRVVRSLPNHIFFAASQSGIKQPLLATVPTSALPFIQAALDRGERRVLNVWRDCGAEPVIFADDGLFFNVNTQDDLSLIMET